MSVSNTSQEAYDSVKPKLGDRQRSVYNTIKVLGSPNNEQIAEFLKWPINTITPRVLELRAFGMVAHEGYTFSKSGRRTKMWSVCDLNDRNLKELDCES